MKNHVSSSLYFILIFFNFGVADRWYYMEDICFFFFLSRSKSRIVEKIRDTMKVTGKKNKKINRGNLKFIKTN